MNSRRASSMVRIFFTWKSGSARPARPVQHALEQVDRVGRHLVLEPGVLVGPQDAAHRAGEVLDAEGGVLAARVAALVARCGSATR